MKDEEFYLIATNEVEGEKKQPALWAKVLTLAEGDLDKAKYQYIKLRVAQLIEEKKVEKPVFTKNSNDEFDIKYMPVSEFSTIKSIPEKKVIEMIRDGFYIGQIKDNQWFVSRDEAGKEEGSNTYTEKNAQNINTSNEVRNSKNQNEGSAKTIYILYLVGIVFGITGVVGVIMAYVNKSDSADWIQTHYDFQIRTFWIGGIFGFFCFWFFNMNSNQFLGVPVLLFWIVWLIVRCTKGMKFLEKKTAHPDPKGFMF